MGKSVRFNGRKFRELLLYVAQRSQTDPRFGATKLNKVLYYADFAAFRILGSPITGAKYRRLQEGPVPRQLVDQRDRLVAEEKAHVEKKEYYSGFQQRLVSDEEPDLGVFSQAEMSIIDEVIDDLWHLDARGVSDRSHREAGWMAAKEREDIPYHTAWVSSAPITPEEQEFGHNLAADLAPRRA